MLLLEQRLPKVSMMISGGVCTMVLVVAAAGHLYWGDGA